MSYDQTQSIVFDSSDIARGDGLSVKLILLSSPLYPINLSINLSIKIIKNHLLPTMPLSSLFHRSHPDELHAPSWHATSNRPIVGGKYHDPETGEVRDATGHEFSGPLPPWTSSSRISTRTRPAVVEERKLMLDSVNATPYAIRVVLAHGLSGEEFGEVAGVMVDGVWGERVG
ncbi:hypothetical protein BO70DRAFT_382694 [Aspergillus heteromorphus CBS 117.55]|uniref:Uncharacterized protein n=1 Tax=Aspergillus heteromorphus CBS 117.55 TaxID=1448321 RepID=A0A317V6P0_9EURO|nr:uncharacterized protein BO70DRAFT_382694 [Aspergillus heteromorphus CBS 117.55]PWY68617.1 hypothetical protein BO70DRAFT_382694 [Aspergillus heteromorphus CBS 117.55]